MGGEISCTELVYHGDTLCSVVFFLEMLYNQFTGTELFLVLKLFRETLLSSNRIFLKSSETKIGLFIIPVKNACF